MRNWTLREQYIKPQANTRTLGFTLDYVSLLNYLLQYFHNIFLLTHTPLKFPAPPRLQHCFFNPIGGFSQISLLRTSCMQDRERDTDVYNGLLDSEGEGEGGMIWENDILTCILSCKNWIASLCLMQDTACLELVHGDDPERCYGDGGGRGVHVWECM